VTSSSARSRILSSAKRRPEAARPQSSLDEEQRFGGRPRRSCFKSLRLRWTSSTAQRHSDPRADAAHVACLACADIRRSRRPGRSAARCLHPRRRAATRARKACARARARTAVRPVLLTCTTASKTNRAGGGEAPCSSARSWRITHDTLERMADGRAASSREKMMGFLLGGDADRPRRHDDHRVRPRHPAGETTDKVEARGTPSA